MNFELHYLSCTFNLVLLNLYINIIRHQLVNIYQKVYICLKLAVKKEQTEYSKDNIKLV